MTEGDGGVKRQTCAFDGDSFLGSKGGAKASVDFIYQAPVLNKGASVRDMCEVAKILPDRNGSAAGYSVHFSNLRERKKGNGPCEVGHSRSGNDEHVEAAVRQQFGAERSQPDAFAWADLWRQWRFIWRLVQGLCSTVGVRVLGRRPYN